MSLGSKNKETSDQVIFLGAGSITKWAHAFSAWEKTGGVKHDAFGCFLEGRISNQSKMVRDMSLGSMTTMGVGGGCQMVC